MLKQIRQFLRLFTNTPSKDPVYGESWILSHMKENPFTRKRYTVQIEDVKEGWVQYKLDNNIISEKAIPDFKATYELVKKEKACSN